MVALSLVFVGVVGLRGRPKNWTWFAAAVLAFGLAHGLGLSTRLQDLGLPSDGMIPRVLAFNIGVEIGQLIAGLGMFMLGDVLSHYIPRLRDPRLSHGALVAAGAVAASVLVFTSGGQALRPIQADATAVVAALPISGITWSILRSGHGLSASTRSGLLPLAGEADDRDVTGLGERHHGPSG